MRLFPTLVLVGALAVSAPALADPADPAAPHDPDDSPTVGAARTARSVSAVVDRDRDPGGERSRRQDRRWHDQQTSDGRSGEIARRLPPTQRGKARSSLVQTWAVSPGVTASVWDETGPRGPVRYYVTNIDYRTPGVRLDYTNAGKVRSTGTVPSMVAGRGNVVAAVNGDFYDIGDTGAPLGLGVSRKRGTLNGRWQGWNDAFYYDRRNQPQIGEVGLKAKVRRHPEIKVTNVNSPFVYPGRVGIYTSAWGQMAGYRVTDGQRKGVRMVLLRKGKVVWNGGRLFKNKPIRGTMLIGRGASVKPLRKLKVGTRVRLAWQPQGQPKMAITGNHFLLRDGKRIAIDDRELHPRTAIGIDHDTHRIFLLAVDGRRQDSRGYTMVELARKMAEFGADDALNLDGGGSTTMMMRTPRGPLGVVNRPSDGFLRSVANGLAVTYTAPKKARGKNHKPSHPAKPRKPRAAEGAGRR